MIHACLRDSRSVRTQISHRIHGSSTRLVFAFCVYSQVFIRNHIFMIMIASRKAHSSLDCDQSARRSGWNLETLPRRSITHTRYERGHVSQVLSFHKDTRYAHASASGYGRAAHNFAAFISPRGSMDRSCSIQALDPSASDRQSSNARAGGLSLITITLFCGCNHGYCYPSVSVDN